MQLVQILDCSDIGTCCTDYGVVAVIDVARRLIGLVQMLVPIILIVAVIFQLSKMMMNPDDKKNIKSIFNKAIAAAAVFFIPMVFDISIGVFPQDFSITSCWESAKVMREISKAAKLDNSALSDKKATSIISNPDDYEKGVKKEESSSSRASGVGAQRMLSVAIGELGTSESGNGHHKYEAFSGLSDYDPWCAAFVTWVGGQAGFLDQNIMPRFTACYFPRIFSAMGNDIHYEGSGYNPKAGDLIFFSWKCNGVADHVGIVESYDSNYVYTVEGNTTCNPIDSSLNSKCSGTAGVYRKKRVRNCTIYGYATPNYPS